jgi:hypothetical protein
MKKYIALFIIFTSAAIIILVLNKTEDLPAKKINIPLRGNLFRGPTHTLSMIPLHILQQ